ncbi:transposase IS3/IS911 family protein [Pusillimonas sp. T7-7]|nr:transposase IS3/IS911 family protein [Pusillimonas sp. T7-7]
MKERKVAHRRYTDDYKLESARLAQSLSTNEAARRLGIPSATLGRWRRELDAAARASSGAARQASATPRRPVVELEAENRRLRKELASARLDIEILGKATAYFAKGSR